MHLIIDRFKNSQNIIIFMLILVLSACSFLFTPKLALSAEDIEAVDSKFIKKPNVSGSFYPANADNLNKMIDLFLDAVKEPPSKEHVYGMISPHAGYVYSGPVAARNYKSISKPIKAKNRKYKTVVILSPSHHYRPAIAGVYPHGGFETPLGVVLIDDVFANQLINQNKTIITANTKVFKKEHAVEVQIPFLQKTLNDFKIVPIIIPNDSKQLCQSLGAALAKLIGTRRDVLVIASSDMSHYHNLKTANIIDKDTLSLILSARSDDLYKSIHKGTGELCGSAAVITLMNTMNLLGVHDIKLLGYDTSADSAFVSNPDKNRVVGYGSIIFTKKNKRSPGMLNDAQRKELLDIARKSIVDIVEHDKINNVSSDDPLFSEHRGAFVTINKEDHLRGCIGLIKSDRPLINVVNDMAIQAATQDPRFPALTTAELDDISLEISVMSPIEQITDVSLIEVGKHGLIIRKGFNSGLLLPQVATDYNWNREEFLEHTCQKAGLDPNAWKDGAEIFIFSAEVFGEED